MYKLLAVNFDSVIFCPEVDVRIDLKYQKGHMNNISVDLTRLRSTTAVPREQSILHLIFRVQDTLGGNMLSNIMAYELLDDYFSKDKFKGEPISSRESMFAIINDVKRSMVEFGVAYNKAYSLNGHHSEQLLVGVLYEFWGSKHTIPEDNSNISNNMRYTTTMNRLISHMRNSISSDLVGRTVDAIWKYESFCFLHSNFIKKIAENEAEANFIKEFFDSTKLTLFTLFLFSHR